jgi:hypothetical protein
MSDVMLLGVLRMPIEYGGGPLSPMAQFVSRAREAADRIESDAAELRRLHAENERLTTLLADVGQVEAELAEKSDEVHRLHALVAACEPYLKEGETPAERIERERRDTEAVCRLYAKERERNVELLEALKDMVDHGDATAFAKARAAIAKAEGEQP